jgi:hypothetical protein
VATTTLALLPRPVAVIGPVGVGMVAEETVAAGGLRRPSHRSIYGGAAGSAGAEDLGRSLAATALHLAIIQRRAWKANSANLALTTSLEVPQIIWKIYCI